MDSNETLSIKNDLERKNGMRFDRVWIVFDKDDFTDFNEAINLAKKYGFCCAWTNEAFELWYFLHFEYLDTGISRDSYIEKLRDAIRTKSGDSQFWYDKGNPNNYHLLQKYGNEELAKRHARRLRKLFSGTDYASHKPCTMVDVLVNELEHPDKLIPADDQ